MVEPLRCKTVVKSHLVASGHRSTLSCTAEFGPSFNRLLGSLIHSPFLVICWVSSLFFFFLFYSCFFFVFITRCPFYFFVNTSTPFVSSRGTLLTCVWRDEDTRCSIPPSEPFRCSEHQAPMLQVMFRKSSGRPAYVQRRSCTFWDLMVFTCFVPRYLSFAVSGSRRVARALPLIPSRL